MYGDPLTSLERDVIEMIVRRDHPVMAALRAQLAVCRTKSRTLTGVGFYTQIVVPQTLAVPGIDRMTLGDVHAEIPGVDHGAGFVLFIEDGMLETLEGFTYDGAWPDHVDGYAVSANESSGNTPSDLETVEEHRARDAAGT